jgi:hypothetical protein
MIRFRTKTAAGKDLIGLGLSHANLAHLEQGQPILFDGRELALGDLKVMIFTGETEEAMRRELADHGLIPPEAAAGRIAPGERQEWHRGGDHVG